VGELQYTKLPSEYTVALPQDTLSVVVYMNTWIRLKERIRKCKRGVSFWEGLLWTMVGVLLPSAVSGYLDFRDQKTFAITPWMVVAAVSLAVGAIARIGLVQSITHETDSVEAILAEMEEIQVRFTRSPQ